MTTLRLFSVATRPFLRFFPSEPTIVDKERLALLLFCYLPIMLVGVATNFLGLTQPSAPFFNYTHTLCLIVAAVALLLFCLRKINMAVCLGAFTIIGQSILGVEMIFCAMQQTNYYNFLIIANTVLLALNTMASLAAYLKINTIFLALSTIGVYIACAFIADSNILKSFIVVFAVAFFFVCFAGVMVATTTKHLETSNDKLEKDNSKLEKDNQNYRREEQEILQILHLRKSEVMAYLSLASQRHDYDSASVLFERLDSKSRHYLFSNVEDYIKTRTIDLETIKKVFPKFSPSEREICRLILLGKKLGEICFLLKKNESNVNSQRANMRRKLGLQPTDNLQKELEERFSANSPTP